jgi:heat shock protein HslJ
MCRINVITRETIAAVSTYSSSQKWRERLAQSGGLMRPGAWFCCISIAGMLTLGGCTGSESQSTGGVSLVERSDVVGEWEAATPASVGGDKQRVAFADDGTWSGSLDGCNAQSGKWTFESPSQRVEFQDMASTLKSCERSATSGTFVTVEAADVTSSKLTLLDGETEVGTLAKAN